jgi:hypothetical protein
MKRTASVLLGAVAAFASVPFLAGCSTDATIASRNLSIEAGNFQIDRRIVFYNGITGGYILTIEGRCQVEHAEKLSVTCKTGDNAYKKHYLGLSDNVTYFAEQLESKGVSVYRYKVVFKPEAIIPDIDLRTSAGDGYGG